jgi:hypothetical protein
VNAASNRRLATKIIVEKKTAMNKEAIGTLTGKLFHSVKSDRETIEWQGKFLGLASPGLYRVQLYEWFTGCESEQLLVPAVAKRLSNGIRRTIIIAASEKPKSAPQGVHSERTFIERYRVEASRQRLVCVSTW